MISCNIIFHWILLGCATTAATASYDFVLAPNDEGYKVSLTDVSTNLSDIPTVFQNANATVHVHDIHWGMSEANDTSGARLVYTTFLNDELVQSATGELALQDMVPPSTIGAGWIVMEDLGRHNLTITLQVQYDTPIVTPLVSTLRFYQCYFPFLTLAPIAVILVLAYLTGNVEISISTTNLVSMVIVHGHFFRGMENLVYGSFLGALTDTYNGVITVLVFFLGGIISLVEVTGGSKGLVRFAAKYMRQTRVVQLLAFASGVCYFWDDTLSLLMVGHLFRPILDAAHTSRPLQALILDASGGTISGVVILSTWLVWEIPLLQQELSRIETSQGIPSLQMTPLEVLQQSLRYSFYPIFMLCLVPLTLFSQRHAGQVLMYERVSQVYQSKHGGPKDTHGPCQPNLPVPRTTPCRYWNSVFPIGVITCLFIFFWFSTGSTSNPDYAPPPGEQWIVTTYAYSQISLSWLQAISMGASFHVLSLLLQWQEGDSIFFLPFAVPKILAHSKAQKAKEKAKRNQRTGEEDGLVLSNQEEEGQVLFQPLLPMMELIGSFFFGFSRVMPFMIQFMLAWALRQSWQEMGLDRWMASMFGEVLKTIPVEMMPTAAFVAATFISMAGLGANQGQVASILLPMAVTPVYTATYLTHPSMVFQVIGAILSGCIAGDHASPLSNTTLLSCLASDCHVIVHIITQIPYIAIVFIMSVVLGTGPVAYGIYPVGAGYFLGVVFLLFFVFFLCYPILDPSGQWDLATRLYIRCLAKKGKAQDEEHSNEGALNNAEDSDNDKNATFWEILQRDTIRAAAAMAQGVPYNTEDCRYLMSSIDSGITKGHPVDRMHCDRASSSCGSSMAERPTLSPVCRLEEEGSEDPASEGQPLRIVATDGNASDAVIGLA